MEPDLVLLDVCDGDFEGVPDARVLLLWLLEGGGRGFFSMLPDALDERCVVRVEAVRSDCVSRSF